MIEYADAQALVASATRTLPAETVPLARALGRTLARNLKAREDIPPFTKAAMDGFAVRAADTSPAERGPVTLRIVEDLPAGRLARRAIGPGQAARIMTGAPLPPGADAVVMVEDAETSGRGVILRRAVRQTDAPW